MTVILVAHILVSIILIIVVLMQRSEGGALGIGGGGGGGGAGGLMTGRGVAGALVRTTIIFGAIFFVTSLGLTTIASKKDNGGITEIEQDLIDEFGNETVDDSLGIDVIQDAETLDVGDDPLAVTPTPSTPAETPAEDDTETDPVADPLADPQ